jgi:fumarylacetoacetase
MPTNPESRLDQSHDQNLKSWVESANLPSSDFPIQNLPLVTFTFDGKHDEPTRCGVAIGDEIVDLMAAAEEGVLDEDLQINGPDSFVDAYDLMSAGNDYMAELRSWAINLLQAGNMKLAKDKKLRTRLMRRIDEVIPLPPMAIQNYTDFYASIHHATNVGGMFRPENPLLPNYKHVPIGYHGRASSILASGSDIVRPNGQTKADDAPAPSFGPSTMLDYELEIGALIAMGNELAEPIALAEADDFLFGLCLVNDWSARDIQKWEYQPLGPFLAKNFSTTISPFVITLAALEPFRCPGATRPEGDTQPLEYLRHAEDAARGGFDINLEVLIRTEQMREKDQKAFRLSKGSFRDMYWTMGQLLAHHTSGGCNMMPGDLIASGTISGPTRESRGCLLELSWNGHGPDGKPLPRTPIELPSGEKRTFLEDGDEIIMRAWCERPGFRRIGFGECSGMIVGE